VPSATSAEATIEAAIRDRGLRCRSRPIDQAAGAANEPSGAHHRAVVWDAAGRLRGSGWSDPSANAALAGAIAAFLALAGQRDLV
jgi:hypothetical protein